MFKNKKILLAIIVCFLLYSIDCKSALREFMITLWCPPPVTEDMRYYQNLIDEGYNLSNISVTGTDPRNLNLSRTLGYFDLLDSLNRLDKNKGREIYTRFYSDAFICESVLSNQAASNELIKLVNQLKNKPWFDSYHIIDEPTYSQFGHLSAISKIIRQIDPNRPHYVNLHPSYATYKQIFGYGSNEGFISTCDYRRYVEAAIDTFNLELISYNNYIFHRSPADSVLYPEYFRNIGIIRDIALKRAIPFINIVQSSKLPGNGWVLPTMAQLKWQAYTTLAYGAKGICWFLYWGDESFQGAYINGRRQPIADQLKLLNHEIRLLGNEMKALTSTNIFYAGSQMLPETHPVPDDHFVQIYQGETILAMFSNQGIENTFMVLNLNHDEHSGRKHIPIKIKNRQGELKQFTIEENPENKMLTSRWEPIMLLKGDDDIIIGIDPGEGILLKIVTE